MRRLIAFMLSALLCAVPVSALVSPVSADDDPCRNQILLLIDNAGLDASKSAPAFGCRQNSSGRWYMGHISLLANPRAFDDLGETGNLILAAVDRLSTDRAFKNSIRFDRHTSTVTYPGRGGAPEEVDFSVESIGAGPNWLNNLRDSYSDSIVNYLTKTAGDESLLVEYMQWFMARRDTSLMAMTSGMDPLSGPSFQNAWGYLQFPWPWQLPDPESITAYSRTSLEPENTVESVNSVESSEQTLGSIEIRPSNPIAVPGGTLDLAIEYPRLQGINAVAFQVYGQRLLGSGLPFAEVDGTGASACNDGGEGVDLSAFNRARTVTEEPPFPPRLLSFTVSPSAEPGDELRVCIQVIGYSQGKKLFTWIAESQVEVVRP